MRLSLLALATLAAWPSAAQEKTTIEYEPEVVFIKEILSVCPPDDRLFPPPPVRFAPLVWVRTSFEEELMESVDSL